MKKWSKDAIDFVYAEKHGKYLGSFWLRKNGFGPELWTMEVFNINGKLFAGDRLEGMLEPTLDESKNDILQKIKK